MGFVQDVVSGVTGNLATDMSKWLARKAGNTALARQIEKRLNPDQLHPVARDLLAEALAEGLGGLGDIDPVGWKPVFEHPENRLQLIDWVLEWRDELEPDLGEWSLENAPNPELLRGLLLRLHQIIQVKKRKYFPPYFFNLLGNQMAMLEAISDLGERLDDFLSRMNELLKLPPSEKQLPSELLIPKPPAPYLPHYYPMPKNWTGRQTEMDRLDTWLRDNDGPPMCCLVAIGGMGKSSLAWAWLQRRVVRGQEALGLSGIFHWSFYEGEVSFRRFLEDLSAYLGVSAVSDPVTVLTQRLCKQRVLLVLDGFERLLCAYAAVDAALLPERAAEELRPGERRCIEWATARFLRSLVAGDASKTLLISRLVPEDLDGLAGWLPMELTGLDPTDTADYLQASGIKGTSRELRDAAAVYDFHPLSLSKLVNFLHYDIHQPDDISQAPRYDVATDLKARQHHILEQAYEVLPPALGQFLSALAALRGKPTMEVVRLLAGDWPDAELSANLRRLEGDRWVLWDREQRTLDFHPVVRRYVYGRLKDKLGIHTRLADYFRPLAEAVDTQRVESVADLAPTIELYHHTVRAGRYDEARELFRDRLHNQLYYRFGAYQTQIELLRALFPDGEERPPRLKEESAQAWTLAALANSYSLSGQPRHAVPLFGMQNALQEKLGRKDNLAIGLGNLASIAQTILGELTAAEGNLRRSIELFHEVGYEFGEAVDHQELGRLLAYQGAFDEAARELDASYNYDTEHSEKQGQCVDWAYHALRALLMEDAGAALAAARRARELADILHPGYGKIERDIIRAEWLLGWSSTFQVSSYTGSRAQVQSPNVEPGT
jgi:tetratricopeptide (TPR) repeat protein